MEDWTKYVDLTLLYPDYTKEEFESLLDLAKKYQVSTIVVPPILEAFLDTIGTYRTTTVINFPLAWSGYWLEEDFKYAKEHHVDEIDVVLPIRLIKNKEWLLLEEKLRLMRDWAGSCILKGIIETGCLTMEEIKKISVFLRKANFNYVKTCTGYGPRGVELNDIHIIKESVPKGICIKASGGIRDVKFAKDLLMAGADRLGIGLRAFKEMIKYDVK